MNVRLTVQILVNAIAITSVVAQTDSHPTFDVASIKSAAVWKSGGEGSNRSRIEFTPKSLTLRNVDLTECVQWAYSVKPFQVSGRDFLHSEHFDIQAVAADPVAVNQLRAMLQDLLAKRFKLATHRETKMLPVYELLVAKDGPKLPAPNASDVLTHTTESLPRVQEGSFIFKNSSLPEFAEKLSLLRGIELPVVDRTGIPGVFDITLKSAAAAILQPDGPSLFTLIQEQLGLRLSAAKAPFEVLVIDHAERPSDN